MIEIQSIFKKIYKQQDQRTYLQNNFVINSLSTHTHTHMPHTHTHTHMPIK